MSTNPRTSRETERPSLALNGSGPAMPQMSPRQILERRTRNAPGLTDKTPEQRAAHREICAAAGLSY
jgi:hypothetical protein